MENKEPLSNSDSANQEFIDELQEIRREGEALLARMNRLSVAEIQRAKTQAEAIDLARVYFHLRVTIEAFKEEFKGGISRTYQRLCSDDFPTMLEARGVANVPLVREGKTISPSVRTFCKMLNKPACVHYLLNHEEEDPDSGEMVKPYQHIPSFSVNANTLASTAKELAKEGKQFPDHLTDEKGEKILDENGVPLSMFETGHVNNTTWRAAPKKKG